MSIVVRTVRDLLTEYSQPPRRLDWLCFVVLVVPLYVETVASLVVAVRKRFQTTGSGSHEKKSAKYWLLPPRGMHRIHAYYHGALSRMDQIIKKYVRQVARPCSWRFRKNLDLDTLESTNAYLSSVGL